MSTKMGVFSLTLGLMHVHCAGQGCGVREYKSVHEQVRGGVPGLSADVCDRRLEPSNEGEWSLVHGVFTPLGNWRFDETIKAT